MLALGKIQSVDEVVANLMPKVRNPDSSKQAKKKAYIENMRLCRNGGRAFKI